MIPDYTLFKSSFTKFGYETVNLYNSSFPFACHKDKVGVDMLPYPSHFHKEVEVHYIIDGEANILCNQCSYHADKDSVIVIPPYMLHRFENITPCCETHVFLFDPSILGNFAFICDDFPACTITKDSVNIASLQKIIEEMRFKLPHYEFTIRGELLSFFARLSRSVEPNSSDNDNSIPMLPRIKKTISYIEEHFTEKINVRELSNLANLSPSYFSYCFSQSTGKTVMAYILDLRCQYAYRLIASGEKNVSEAANLSGFDNYSYFSRKYRETFGFLPSKTPKIK